MFLKKILFDVYVWCIMSSFMSDLWGKYSRNFTICLDIVYHTIADTASTADTSVSDKWFGAVFYILSIPVKWFKSAYYINFAWNSDHLKKNKLIKYGYMIGNTIIERNFIYIWAS